MLMPIFVLVEFAFRNIISYNDDIIWKNNSLLLACLLAPAHIFIYDI
jgi:hypothetical protein